MMASGEKKQNEKYVRKSNMDSPEYGQEQICGTMPPTLQDVPVSEAVQRAHDELIEHWTNIYRAKEHQLKKLRTQFLRLHLNSCRVEPTEGSLYRREIEQWKAAMIEKKVRRFTKTTDFRWLEDGLISTTTNDSERKFLKKLKSLKKGLKFLGHFLPKFSTISKKEKYKNVFGQHWKYPHLYRETHLELIAKYCGFFGLKTHNVMGNHLFPEPDYVVTRKRRSGNIIHRAQFGDYLLDYTRCGTVHVLPRLSEMDEVIFGSVDEEEKITPSYDKPKAARQTGSNKTSADNSKNCLKSLDPRLGNLKFTRRFESPSCKSKLPINEAYLMRCNTENLKLPKIQNAQRQQETGRLNIKTAEEHCEGPTENVTNLNLRTEIVKLPKIGNTHNGEGNNGLRTMDGKLCGQQNGSRPNRLQDGSGPTCRLPVIRNTHTAGSAPWTQKYL